MNASGIAIDVDALDREREAIQRERQRSLGAEPNTSRSRYERLEIHMAAGVSAADAHRLVRLRDEQLSGECK